jgi:hypothetical protein
MGMKCKIANIMPTVEDFKSSSSAFGISYPEQLMSDWMNSCLMLWQSSMGMKCKIANIMPTMEDFKSSSSAFGISYPEQLRIHHS